MQILQTFLNSSSSELHEPSFSMSDDEFDDALDAVEPLQTTSILGEFLFFDFVDFVWFPIVGDW